MRRIVLVLILLLIILHQDFWWNDDHRTLIMGFLPVSLAYHVGISIASSIVWGMACIYCWPRDLEVLDREAADAPPSHGGH